MTREREGELLMVGLTILESWFPILSIVAMSYVGGRCIRICIASCLCVGIW